MPRKSKPEPKAQVIAGSGEWVDVQDVQNGWRVTAHFDFPRGASAPWITRLVIESSRAAEPRSPTPLGGITADVLRSIKTPRLYEALGADEASAWTLGLHGVRADDDLLGKRRPGRTGQPDSHFAVWAARYIERVNAGSRKPYPELAAAHPGWSDRSIRDAIQEARRRGLIAGMKPGRVGGYLTSKGRKALERKGQ